MAATATTDQPTFQSKMDTVGQLSPQDLAALQDEISAAFQDADEHNDLDKMAEAADANDVVEAQAQKLGVDLDKVREQQTAEEPKADDGGDGSQVAGAEQPAASNTSQEATVDAPPVAADRQPVPVAASGVRVVVGGDVPGFSAGMEFSNKKDFTQAMSDKINALRGATGQGEHVLVASVKAPEVPEQRLLTGDPTDFEKIFDGVGRTPAHTKALVASGGYCAPLEPRYEVFGIGTTDRPVRGALPGFRSTRGGITFIAPPKLSGVTGSVGVWTASTDASPGGSTKNKLVVVCGTQQNVSISAITLEMQFGNFIARAYPEMVERNTELGMIAQARLAEQTLLSGIGTLSTAVTVTSALHLGIAREWLPQVSQAAAAYRTRHRMDADAPLRVIAPAWVRDAIRDDIAISKNPTSDDVLGESDSQIESWLSARNINVAWHLDDFPNFGGTQFAGALNLYPTTMVWYLFAEGTFLFLDGGTLDIGIVRDSTLVGTNDYIQFTENFEAVAMVGVESYKVTSTFTGTGAPVIGQTGN